MLKLILNCILILMCILILCVDTFDTFDTTQAAENWCTPEAPYEDPLPLSELPLPHEAESNAVTWKRPSQFLPPIPEPTHAQSSTPPAPLVPEPKAPVKKGGAAAATPAAVKKGAAGEHESVKKPPPKHAHVRIIDIVALYKMRVLSITCVALGVLPGPTRFRPRSGAQARRWDTGNSSSNSSRSCCSNTSFASAASSNNSSPTSYSHHQLSDFCID